VANNNYRLKFPGQQFDAESSLHYNYQRTYAPDLGRYLEADPIGLDGGWNRFAYAGANPVRYTDSLGLFVDTAWDAGNLMWDLWHQNWGDAATSAAALCIPFAPAGASKADDLWNLINKWRKSGGAKGKGNPLDDVGKKAPETRTRTNKVQPDQNATGDHTTWKTENGDMTRHETWTPNPKNPTGWDSKQSTDLNPRSAPHTNKNTGEKIPTPHTQGKDIPGGVRPALPIEMALLSFEWVSCANPWRQTHFLLRKKKA
jgi:RHS repeat-associated protein